MPRYFTQKISTKELEQKILAAWKEHEYYDGENYADTPRYHNFLTSRIGKDLRKVSFDTENIEDGSHWDFRMPEFIGYHTLENGLSYLGVGAGGDWEQPVFFILYWDGSELRGYIPTEGNLWNTDTNQAYGNDEEADEKNAKKRGLGSVKNGSIEKAEYDKDKLVQDISERIVYKQK